MFYVDDLDKDLRLLINQKFNERELYINKHVETIHCPLHLFIDGNHLYKNSKEDLKGWLDHLNRLHDVAPYFQEISTPEAYGEDNQFIHWDYEMFRGDRNYWESRNNDFKFSKDKHLRYCSLFLQTAVNLIRKDIEEKLIHNLIEQKKVHSKKHVLNNTEFNNLKERLFGQRSFFTNNDRWFFDDFSYATMRMGTEQDKDKFNRDLKDFENFLKTAKKLTEFNNLSFMGSEVERRQKFHQYFTYNKSDKESQKRFYKILKSWNSTEDLKHLENTESQIYRIKFTTKYNLYKGSLRSDRLLKSLSHIENKSTKISTKQWCRENKKLISTGKMLWNEKSSKPTSITGIHDFYLSLKNLYKKGNFHIKDRITKWDIVGNEGHYKVVPAEKGVDTALSNDVMKELYKGEEKIICIITNDMDFTSTLDSIEEEEAKSEAKIKQTYLCSAHKKSRIPKELKQYDVNFVFPKDEISHTVLSHELWRDPLPDYSYMVDENAKKRLKQKMENTITMYKNAVVEMEQNYQIKKKKLDDVLKQIDKIFNQLKDSRF